MSSLDEGSSNNTVQQQQQTKKNVPSEKVVSVTLQDGFRNIVIDSSVGLVVGGLIGIVLARGGRTSSLRKSCAGFGAGIGAGSAWTRTSMNLEDTLQSFTASPKTQQ